MVGTCINPLDHTMNRERHSNPLKLIVLQHEDARKLMHLGKNEKALIILETILDRRKCQKSACHLDIAITCIDLGNVHRSLGNHHEALDHLYCALEYLIKVFSCKNRLVCTVMSSIKSLESASSATHYSIYGAPAA